MGLSNKKCKACGGLLIRKSSYLYQCENCDKDYYVSKNKLHKISLSFPNKKLLFMRSIVAVFMIGVLILVGKYYLHTKKMKENTERFSQCFRIFLTEVFEKSIAMIDEDDMESIKYLKIEEKQQGTVFTYSFKDYYECEDEEEFTKNVEEIIVDNWGYSSEDTRYFSGLTKIEIYLGAWQNYVLPESNNIRSITCFSGESKYGKSDFFKNVNPNTLEEVIIYSDDKINDISFLEDISGIRSLYLEQAVIYDMFYFKKFNNLKELTLINAEFDEKNAYEVVEELLQISSLEKLYIEGPSVWYISDDEWIKLQEKYKTVHIERR